jgi:hypothetical protein
MDVAISGDSDKEERQHYECVACPRVGIVIWCCMRLQVFTSRSRLRYKRGAVCHSARDDNYVLGACLRLCSVEGLGVD